MLFPIFAAVLIVVFVIWAIVSSKRHSKFPPGPPKVPVLGSAPFLKVDKQLSIFNINQDLHKRFGDIVGYYFGSQPMVLVNEFTIVKELFKRDDVTLRPAMEPTNTFRHGYNDPLLENTAPGVVSTNGKIWQEQRRFILRNLREFGFGKASMEDALLEEAQKLCKELKKNQNTPMKLSGLFNISIVNALWHIMVNETFELDDPKAVQLAQAVNDGIQKSNLLSPIAFILPNPKMAKLPGLWELCKFNVAQKALNVLTTEMKTKVTEHLQTIDHDEPRDFLDQYLKKVAETSDQKSSFFEERGRTFAINMLVDMFLAGMETTATSLLWTVLYLIHHPEVQEKMSEEIKQVIGSIRPPSFADEAHMPYTCAVIHESHRKNGLAHMGVPHATSADVQIGKYNLPKGSIVISNLYAIMHDPDHFTEPHTFNPERFIDSEGQFQSHERVIPFSIGKRYCLGQSLAEKEFFLFIVTLVQQFEFKRNPNKELPRYDNVIPEALARGPPEFEVMLKSRC